MDHAGVQGQGQRVGPHSLKTISQPDKVKRGELNDPYPIFIDPQRGAGSAGLEGILQSLLNQVLIFIFANVIITSAVKIIQMAWRLIKGRLPV